MLLGSETPRIWTPPLRRLTPKTSLGFAVVDFAETVLGITLHPWQQWLLIHALELLPDGTFRFRTVVLLVARQSGKSTLLQILALFFMYVRGVDLVIGTAQNLDIAEEVWQGAVDIAEDVPELAAEIDHIVRMNGKKTLELRQGERYKVQAANRRGGRGLSGDLVMMDELREHQSWDAWAAVTKTTMARSYAQVWAASNAGDDSSVVLKHLRLMAHTALGNPDGLDIELDQPDDVEVDDSLGIFEWSADPALDTRDTDGWAQANPSLGYTITERAIRSAHGTDPEWVFRTEVLCQWQLGPSTEPKWEVISEANWETCSTVAGSDFLEPPCTYAVEITPDRRWASIVAASTHPAGIAIEVGEHRSGTDWLIPRIVDLWQRRNPRALIIDPLSPAAPLIRELQDEHSITVTEISGADWAKACGSFYDATEQHTIAHRDQGPLTLAVGHATKRNRGDAWVFDRRSDADVTPLTAAALARWGHLEIPEPEVEPMVAWV